MLLPNRKFSSFKGTESEGSAFADTLPIQRNMSPQKAQQPLPFKHPINTTEDSSQQANNDDEDDFQFNKSLKTTDSEDDPIRRNSRTTGRQRTRVMESDEKISTVDKGIKEKKLTSSLTLFY